MDKDLYGGGKLGIRGQEPMIDEVEMQKNEWAREEAKRINNGGEPSKYTPEMWAKIKEYLHD